MKSCRLHFIPWLAVTVFLWMSGCATTQDRKLEMTAKTSNVSIGPVQELLKVKTARDKVRVVLDRSGLGHVIVALTQKDEVHHIVVGHESILEHEVIQSSISPWWTIDAAFDAAGLLHVLIDDEHWIKKDDLWCNVERTPWKEAGLKVVAPRFVTGATDLIWAFNVKGKEFGAPTRWDWFAFGGYGGVIIWPWPTRARKLILVPEMESNYTTWVILDPNDKRDVDNWQLAAEAEGTVHIIYDAVRYLFFDGKDRPRYAQFTVEDRFSEIGSGASNTIGFRCLTI